jgi:hypothetical protein
MDLNRYEKDSILASDSDPDEDEEIVQVYNNGSIVVDGVEQNSLP